MKTSLRRTILAATVAAGAVIAGLSGAHAQDTSVKLLSAQFEPRQVVQIEVGDFHFLPGQIAPIHTHDAPAVGYVAKGSIIYQVEGERPQILREGDAFYEPAGPQILRFDNASATEEAIFLDFNLERDGDPFIVFETPLTEAIDRRSLPTIDLDDQLVDQVDIYASDLAADGALTLDNAQPTLGLVAEGVVELQIDGQPAQRIIAGGSFALPTDATGAVIANASSEVSATVITFLLH